MSLNEATLEARIDNLLKSVFPTFKEIGVIHQTSFTLKFGHHEVTINGGEPKKNHARAISDIILKVGDKNLILLELKREGLKITPADIEQGLSYARLLHPMPPITLISNGQDTFFYDTYSKEEIKNPPSINLQYVEGLIQTAFRLTTADQQNTVNTLLNNDSEIITQLFNNLSLERFERLKGAISDLTKPISTDFIIARDVLEQMNETLKEKNVLGLTGGAFSGKTSVLYQFFEKYSNKNTGILYLDCRDLNYSIFQELANRFSTAFKFPVTKDKIREWIIACINTENSFSITLLFDNIDATISEVLMAEIIELINLFTESKNAIIFCSDPINFESISLVKKSFLQNIDRKCFQPNRN